MGYCVGRMKGFLQILFAIGICVFSIVQIEAEERTLTILHSNDFEGRFEQMLKVAPVFKRVQQEVGRVLLLDAGNALAPSEDAFVHPNKGGALTVALLNRAGYHAWTLGQRAFDRPVDRLTGYLRRAEFSVLGANLHRSETGRYLFQVQPYTVVRTGGLWVGVLGLGAGGRGVMVADPVAAARYFVPLLRRSSDVVVLLTHLGFEADSTLAASVPGIDVIVGRRSSGSLESHREVNGVLIGQADRGGASLGRIDVTVSEKGVTGARSGLIPLEGVGDPAAALEGWTAEVDGEAMPVAAVLGTASGGFGTASGMGSAMGHLIADLMRSSAKADMAFVAGTHVDPELAEGSIRVLDLYRVYAWSHRLVVLSLEGRQVHAFLGGGLETPGAFFYPSGLEVVYDLSRPEGERLASIRVGDGPLDPGKVYRVAVEDRIAGDGRAGKGLGDLLSPEDRVDTGVLVRDLLGRHIKTAGAIRGVAEERVRQR